MKTIEIIDAQIKELKEKIEVLEEQKRQLNWEDKCFKIGRFSQEMLIRVHKLINKNTTNVKVLCDVVIHELDTFSFTFNDELTLDICLLNEISLNEYRQSINKIHNNLNEKI